MSYHATCPECKNDISFEREEFKEGDHFECPTCGITLEAREIESGPEICEIKNPEIVELEK